MTARFEYPCPDCRTTTNLHDPECRFDGARRADLERAYIDIVSVLSVGRRSERELRSAVEHDGTWTARHTAAFETLKREHRVRETDEGLLELLTPAERKDEVAEPTHDALRTIYEHGSVPGAHDNSVFSLLAYYEMVGLTWAEARDRVVTWLRESGAWDRGGFEESSPEEVVDNKRHVYEEGYGWKEKAQAAKRVIERNDPG